MYFYIPLFVTLLVCLFHTVVDILGKDLFE